MTTYITTDDGHEYTAANPTELVTALRRSAKMPIDTDAEFMANASDWIGTDTGATIETTSADRFIADLIRIGYLKEVQT